MRIKPRKIMKIGKKISGGTPPKKRKIKQNKNERQRQCLGARGRESKVKMSNNVIKCQNRSRASHSWIPTHGKKREPHRNDGRSKPTCHLQPTAKETQQRTLSLSHLSVDLSGSPSFCLFVCLSVCLSIYLSIYLSIFLSLYLPILLSHALPLYPSPSHPIF